MFRFIIAWARWKDETPTINLISNIRLDFTGKVPETSGLNENKCESAIKLGSNPTNCIVFGVELKVRVSSLLSMLNRSMYANFRFDNMVILVSFCAIFVQFFG